MNCPLCDKEATLYAETKPNGKIGVFCRNCRKGFYTLNPEDGWEIIEYNFNAPKHLNKMEHIMSTIHNVNITEEMLNLSEKDFEVFITGDWEL